MKTKSTILLTLAVSVSVACSAQTDTLVMNNERIACAIREVTPDAIKFSYPGEDLANSVYKNSVQKIIFRNGRVQTFAESTSFKKVSSVDDYDNVAVTGVEYEVKGLFKIGDVSSKAKGGTTLSNQERVKQRAYKKMKIEAAMMGANVVYLTNQWSHGNSVGGRYSSSSTAETTLTGVAYSNQLPNVEVFKRLIDNRHNFIAFEENKLWSSASDMKKTVAYKELTITNILDDNGIVTVEGKLPNDTQNTKFRLVTVNDEYFTLYYKDKRTAYNYKVRL